MNYVYIIYTLILILGDSNFCYTIRTSQHKSSCLNRSVPSTLGKYCSYSDTHFSSRVREFRILESLQKIITFVMQQGSLQFFRSQEVYEWWPCPHATRFHTVLIKIWKDFIVKTSAAQGLCWKLCQSLLPPRERNGKMDKESQCKFL